MTTRRRVAVVVCAILAIGGIAIILKPSIAYPLFPRGKQRMFVSEQAVLTIQIAYPEFGRPGVDSAIAAMRQDLVDTAIVTAEEHAHEGDAQNTVTVSYVVAWRSLRYASVVFTVAPRGPAFHGVDYVIARTYDLFADRPLVVTDLSDSDVIATADAAVRERLRTVPGVDADRMRRGLSGGASSFSEFILLGTDDVVFFMNPGQVAPPEQGVIEVTVPRRAFSSK